MRRIGILAALLICCVHLVATRPAQAEVTERHIALAQQVLDQLLAVVDRPAAYDAWPPQLVVIDEDTPNAHAKIDWEIWRKEEKLIPIIGVHTGEIEHIAEWDPGALAFTLGHELAHVTQGHILPEDEQTEIVYLALSREDELEADRVGTQYALAAGYSFKDLMKNLKNTLRKSHAYCSFEGLSVRHPNWQDRIAYLDEDRAELWRSMSAFASGVFFLQAEQYESAEFCFRRVVRDFPDCYEAWANMGYAQLMQYCDALGPDDLRFFDIGQLVVGGFYNRPSSLKHPLSRGPNEELWLDAVGSLREALRLKPELILAKANLGVAYLLRPSGKDVGQATRWFLQVAEALDANAESVQELDPLVRASLLVNSSVVQLSANPTAVDEALADAEAYLSRLAQQGVVELETSPLSQAIRYNRAMAMTASNDAAAQRSAVSLFEQYLRNTSNSLAWWRIAYDRYKSVCESLGLEPQPASDLVNKAASRWRRISSVSVSDDWTIALADMVAEISNEPDAVTPVVKGTSLKRLQFADLHIALLANEEVLAIYLTDPDGPKLQLRRSGVSSQVHELFVGMSKEDFEKLLGADKPFSSILNPNDLYRFYHSVGLAVKFRDGKVAELVIIPMARATGGSKA